MMEEIKKEIKNTFYIDENNMHFEVAEININILFKILDKYKDKEDKYKTMWEELYSENEKELLQSQLDIANKKLDKIKELVNKYGYYTLSEIPELLSIIDGSDKYEIKK
jgi:hypothetical protein